MSLRTRVLRGGVYLGLRQGLGVVLGFAGAILLTRAIGPGAYGLYAASLGTYTYLFSLSQWGIGVYLIRREGEVLPEDYHQAFSLLLLLGIVAGILGFLALPLIARCTNLEGFMPVAAALVAGLPLNLLTLPPLARLERALDYRKVALVELGGQLAYYVVALPLAFSGVGVWAAVVGWWCQQLLMVGLVYKSSGYWPRWHWDAVRLRTMTSYGLGFSASMWVWQLRSLVNPLIVGRYAGGEAVGFVALAIRIVEHLSFLKAIGWRISIAALTTLEKDKSRLTKALTEGMNLQVLAVAPFLVVFALSAPWLIPFFFGRSWIPVTAIYPFIALSYVVNALFNFHSSALYVIRRNWEVAAFHLIHIVLFAGGTWVLVPRLGFTGYGWGEAIALLGYPFIHLQIVKHVGRPNYSLAGLWALAAGMALFWQSLGIVAFLPVLGVLVWPATWRSGRVYWRAVRGFRNE